MNHTLKILMSAVVSSIIATAAFAEEPAPKGFVEVRLWDGVPPATPPGDLPAETRNDDAHVSNVSTPRLWLCLPETKDGAPRMPAVLLLPGGGYGVVGHRYEGTEVANYLKTRGIASAVLLYRCKPQLYPAPLLDARRALQILHQRAASWNLDPGRIGVMGFSAGGHLAGLLSSGVETVPASDPSLRPDFSVLVYPVVRLRGPLSHGGSGLNLLGQARLEAEAPALALDKLIDARWPRTYGLHEQDDPGVPSAGSSLLAGVLEKHGISNHISLVPGKDHGFGWNRPGPDGKPRGPENWLVGATDWILAPQKEAK